MKKLYGIFALAALIASSTSLVGIKKKNSRVEGVEGVETAVETTTAATAVADAIANAPTEEAGSRLTRTLNSLRTDLAGVANALGLFVMTTQEAKQQSKETKIAFLRAHAEPATDAMSNTVLNILIDVVAAKKESISLVDADASDDQLNVVLTRINDLKTLATTTHAREQQG